MLLLALSPATLLALLRLLASVLSVLCPVRPCLSPCVFYVLLHLFISCTFLLLALSHAFSPSTLFALLRLFALVLSVLCPGDLVSPLVCFMYFYTFSLLALLFCWLYALLDPLLHFLHLYVFSHKCYQYCAL